MNSPEEMGNGPVMHDHRRIDPVTGQVREPDRPRGKHAASEPGGYGRDEDVHAQVAHGTGGARSRKAPPPGPRAGSRAWRARRVRRPHGQDRPAGKAGNGFRGAHCPGRRYGHERGDGNTEGAACRPDG